MQSFAIIPAAGRSQRMGQPKLLLPWGGSTVIEHVLASWRASRVDRVLMVVHPRDEELAALGRAGGAEVVQPEVPPGEMKVSVERALEFIAASADPRPSDAWLVAPADMPGLLSATIDQLISAYEASLAVAGPSSRIWAPRSRGRRGHPVLFPWLLAARVAELPANQGINALLESTDVQYVDAGEDAICGDLDTPEDYERLRARHDS